MSNRTPPTLPGFPNPVDPEMRSRLRLLLSRAHLPDLLGALAIVPGAPDLADAASRLAPAPRRAELALTAGQGYTQIGDADRAAACLLRASRGPSTQGQASHALEHLDRPALAARARGAAVLITAPPPHPGAIDCGDDLVHFARCVLERSPARARCVQLGAELLLDLLPGPRLRKHLLNLPVDEAPEICALFEDQWLIHNLPPQGHIDPRIIFQLHTHLETARGPLARALEATEIAAFLESDVRRPQDVPDAAIRNIDAWLLRACARLEALVGTAFPWQRYARRVTAVDTPILRRLEIWEHLDTLPRVTTLDAEDARSAGSPLPEALFCPGIAAWMEQPT